MNQEAALKAGFDLGYMEYDTRLGAYAVIMKDDKILLVRWSFAAEGTWGLPGGGVEYGENCLDAVVREIKEETGLKAFDPRIIAVDTAEISAQDRIEKCGNRNLRLVRLIYQVDKVTGDLKAEESGSTDAVQWFTLAEAKKLSTAGMVETALTAIGYKGAS